MTLSLLAFYRRPGCSLGWGSVTEQLDSGEDYFQKMFIYVYLRLFTFIYVYLRLLIRFLFGFRVYSFSYGL